MASIHIRNVPEPVIEALERRAGRNHRSLQGELRHILTALAEQEPPEALPPIRLHQSKSTQETAGSRDDIYGDDGR